MYATGAYLFAKINTMKSFPGLLLAGDTLTLTFHAKGEAKDSHTLHMLPKTNAPVPLVTGLNSCGKHTIFGQIDPCYDEGFKNNLHSLFAERDIQEKIVYRGYKHPGKRHVFHA